MDDQTRSPEADTEALRRLANEFDERGQYPLRLVGNIIYRIRKLEHMLNAMAHLFEAAVAPSADAVTTVQLLAKRLKRDGARCDPDESLTWLQRAGEVLDDPPVADDEAYEYGTDNEEW